MPRAPARPCAEPRCPKLVDGRSRCDEHDLQRRYYAEHPRASSTARGYGPAWRKARAAFLAEFPNCSACGAPATVVDHIQPHKGDPAKFWDRSNWAPLCKRCHDSKTAKSDGRWRTPPTL